MGPLNKAPFPYHGGKSIIAPDVWAALGDVAHYIEPFFGSGAVLLNRPDAHHWPRTETVNDLNHYIVNVWRAIKAAPDTVAEAVAGPVATVEVNARATRLRSRSAAIAEAMRTDPEAYDAVAAADWIYGTCACIGQDWERTVPSLHLGDAGRGVNALHLGNAGRGVNALHLGDAGQGVNALHLGDAGQGVKQRLRELAARLSRVRVRCGDWRQVCTPAVLNGSGSPVGVFLDPPYDGTGIDYGKPADFAQDVASWARQNGGDPRLRIVLAGHAGDYDLPGWRLHPWTRSVGYSNPKKTGNDNASREMLWLSPACRRPPSLFPDLT